MDLKLIDQSYAFGNAIPCNIRYNEGSSLAAASGFPLMPGITNVIELFNSYAFIILLWQMKSVLGTPVLLMALKPPSTSVKLRKPRACKMEAAIMLR